MLLRVVLCTFIVYQAVNANKNGLEAYEGNPSVEYFWTTVRQTLQHFIGVWNLNDPANVVSRETLQEIWFPIERSFKDKTGSRSWMRISNHFKDTLTHPQAAATLDTLFSCIHRLLLRNASKEIKDLYKGLDEKENAWANLYDLKLLFINGFFKIQEDPKMKASFNTIKKFFLKKIRKSLGESTPKSEEDDNDEDEDKETTSKHNKHKNSDKETPSKHNKHDKTSDKETPSKHGKHEKKSHHKKSHSS